MAGDTPRSGPADPARVGATLQVEVVYALPASCWRARVELPAGARVADALEAADPAGQVPGLVVDPARLGIFGRSVTLDTPLHAGDRIEILRPLLADPKQARRERARESAKR